MRQPRLLLPSSGDAVPARHQADGTFDAFRVDVESERDIVRVCPVGEVDIATVGWIRAEIDELKAAGFTRLILDLRGATFLDSSGLHLAVDAHASAAESGCEFALIAGPAAVQRAFDAAGLSPRLTFVDPVSYRNGASWR